MRKFILATGIRPNIVKAFPLYKYMKMNKIDVKWVHSGQHNDASMFSDLLLDLPVIDNLNIMDSKSKGDRFGNIVKAYSLYFKKIDVDYVIVFGDGDSTLAAALAANKEKIDVIHIEAGLRSFDKTMPEEYNRILTDNLSKFLFVSEPSGILNLKAEGLYSSNTHLVGNIMIDCFYLFKEKIEQSEIIEEKSLPRNYALFTVHRQSNLTKNKLKYILELIKIVKKKMDIVFPVHPHTEKVLKSFNLFKNYKNNCYLIDPLPYIDFMKLMGTSDLVITDSGAVQEETSVLNVPCLTLRKNTERPITLSHGTNQLIEDKEDFERAFGYILNGQWKKSQVLAYWDGRTSLRITAILEMLKNGKTIR